MKCLKLKKFAAADDGTRPPRGPVRPYFDPVQERREQEAQEHREEEEQRQRDAEEEREREQVVVEEEEDGWERYQRRRQQTHGHSTSRW
jgi:hypothetical protein